MENQPHAESEIYQIYVKFWRGDMSLAVYEIFKDFVRERIENVLPISQGTAEARLLQMKILKNKKEK